MIHPVSNLPLASKHRVSQISFHPSQPYLAIQSHDRSVEIFRVRSEEEVKKKQTRRKKRAKEKKHQEQGKSKGKNPPEEPDLEPEDDDVAMEANLVDYFTPHLVVRASGKIRSFDFGSKESNSKGVVQVCPGSTYLFSILTCTSKLFVALSNNAIEVYNVPPPTKGKEESPEAIRSYSVDLPGHRTDVRTLCISSDDQILASASNGIRHSYLPI